jgi:transcriptional regulator with XRE-family HTH domain
LVAAVAREATVEASFDEPCQEDGVWWVELRIDAFETSVSWSREGAFGIYVLSPEFGGKPDEVYAHSELASTRLLQLAAQWRADAKTHPLNLRELRHLVGQPQTEVAQRLGTDQAGISRLERRGDVKLSTLARYMRAMGGEIDIRVRFPTFAAPICPTASFEDADEAKGGVPRLKPRVRGARPGP